MWKKIVNFFREHGIKIAIIGGILAVGALLIFVTGGITAPAVLPAGAIGIRETLRADNLSLPTHSLNQQPPALAQSLPAPPAAQRGVIQRGLDYARDHPRLTAAVGITGVVLTAAGAAGAAMNEGARQERERNLTASEQLRQRAEQAEAQTSLQAQRTAEATQQNAVVRAELDQISQRQDQIEQHRHDDQRILNNVILQNAHDHQNTREQLSAVRGRVSELERQRAPEQSYSNASVSSNRHAPVNPPARLHSARSASPAAGVNSSNNSLRPAVEAEIRGNNHASTPQSVAERIRSIESRSPSNSPSGSRVNSPRPASTQATNSPAPLIAEPTAPAQAEMASPLPLGGHGFHEQRGRGSNLRQRRTINESVEQSSTTSRTGP